MPTAHLSGRLTSGDVEIHFRRWPARRSSSADPILIVHGLSYFSYDWMAVGWALAEDRDVVAMDMRGFGHSSWSASRDYALATLVADVVAVLDHLAWPRAVLVGHSMGGRVCLCTADAHPERVSALVCLDFAPDVAAQGRRHVAERIGNQPDRFASVDDALAYHGHHDVPKGSALWARFEAFLEPLANGLRLRRDLHYRDNFREVLRTGKSQPVGVDLWKMVEQLKMPSLFVRGRSSDMFEQETLNKLRAMQPNAQATEIDGTHDLAGDNPEGVVTVVRNFLDQTATGDRP